MTDESRPRIPESLFTAARRRIAADKRLRRSLPVWGRLHVDRQLPFLVVYRRPQRPDAGTFHLVAGHASYLTASTEMSLRADVRRLATEVSGTLAKVFGACLVLEVWSRAEWPDDDGADRMVNPGFEIVTSRRSERLYLARLEHDLAAITILKRPATVTRTVGKPAPPGLRPLMTPGETPSGVQLAGLVIDPVHQSPGGDTEYPLVRRALQRQLTRALGRMFFEFARHETTHRPATYQALGRRAMVKAVWEADRQLAEISSRFDFLLMVTPLNADREWAAFRRAHYARPPTFLYRPLPFDPTELKRLLYAIRIERIEDPTLEYLFAEQRDHLDRQVTLLRERESARFLHDGLALYGDVEDDLTSLATDILERLPRAGNGGRIRRVNAVEFATLAAAELDRYAEAAPDLNSGVEVREDVSSVMVSRGTLLIGSDVTVPARRVEALIHHEVGTHVVTRFNGGRQPFRQLTTGLAGYEALQEGLAVFAEYLVGGLDRSRLRVIAGRVVAARSVVDGAAFLDTYRLLTERHGFSRRAAFFMTMRVHRGGGFVKDAIYLRGLDRLLSYLGEGGDLRTLVLGKFGFEHLPIVIELRRRGVLEPPALIPRYLSDQSATVRLRRCREGVDLHRLVGEITR